MKNPARSLRKYKTLHDVPLPFEVSLSVVTLSSSVYTYLAYRGQNPQSLFAAAGAHLLVYFCFAIIYLNAFILLEGYLQPRFQPWLFANN